jgi:hypothetical protein
MIPRGELRELITKPLIDFAEKYPEDVGTRSGVQLQIYVFDSARLDENNVLREMKKCVSSIARIPEGVSKVMIYLCKESPLDENGEWRNHISPSSVVLRIDLPFFFAFDRMKLRKYSLYHVRFCIPEEETRLSEKDCEPLLRGYYGITKRNYMTRFSEHYEKARSNTGYLFHSVWHSLLREKIIMYTAIQITGTADSLKEIYELEEEMVGELTLTPKGLNAIPGGMAGIRMLHEMRLLNSTKVGIDERDNALIALQQKAHAHGSPCAHYRRGHMRKLESGKLTYVKPCWVNLKTTEEIAGQKELETV